MNNPWTMGDDSKMFSRRDARLAERRNRRAIGCSWEAQSYIKSWGKSGEMMMNPWMEWAKYHWLVVSTNPSEK
jgi:hypothetical protein